MTYIRYFAVNLINDAIHIPDGNPRIRRIVANRKILFDRSRHTSDYGSDSYSSRMSRMPSDPRHSRYSHNDLVGKEYINSIC